MEADPAPLGGRAALALGLALVLALVAAACAGRPAASGSESGEDRAAPPAVAAGRPVTRDELVDFWYARYRDSYWTAVGDLVDERLARDTAARFGLSVPRPTLDAAVEREVKARQEQWVAAYGRGADLGSAVREAYGTDLAAWRRDVLGPRFEARLLIERVARLDARRRPMVVARVAVLPDPARADAVRRKLEAGADFARTAQQESADASARIGGALPPIARGDLAWREVEERVFAAPVGALVGPLEVVAEGRRSWHVYKVVRRTEPWALPPGAWAARVEADLAERPSERAEVEAWRRRARAEQGVRWYAPGGESVRPPAR